MVPSISNLTPVLNYGRCFLRHPYEHRIRLHNDTELAAKYEIVPQVLITKEDDAPISYQSPQPKVIFQIIYVFTCTVHFGSIILIFFR